MGRLKALGVSLRRRAKRLKRQLWALYLSWKDPRTPLGARLAIACAIGYAASPIDLIPDFVPLLGQLDDLVIVPALVALAIRLIPKEVMALARREAWKRLASGQRVKSPAGTAAAAFFVLLWLFVAFLVIKALGWLP